MSNGKVSKEELERFRENLIKGLPLKIQEGFRNPPVDDETNPPRFTKYIRKLKYTWKKMDLRLKQKIKRSINGD
jgi:RNase P subunit RPR2